MHNFKQKIKSFLKKDEKIESIAKELHKRKGKLFLSILLLVFAVSFAGVDFVKSSNLDNVSGYAWGAEGTEGLGWVSLNCTTGGSCGSVDYGLDIGADNYVTGWAWSSNYGWMKFGGLSGFPTGSGTTADNAKLETDGSITGWARFCAPAQDTSTCTGYDSGDYLNHGGWDGWVSLNGDLYGLGLSAGVISGYAWAGNDDNRNPGWISFTDANYSPVITPTVTISSTPAAIPSGGTITLNWSGSGLLVDSSSCNAYGDWSGPKPYPDAGGEVIGPLSTGNYTFSIQCLGEDGFTLSNTSSVNVSVGGSTVLDFYADPSTSYPPYETTLYWREVSGSPELHSCVANSASPLNSAEIPEWNSTTPIVISTSLNSLTVTVPYNPTSYELTCYDGLNQEVSEIVDVARGTLRESVTLSNNDVVENPAGSGSYTTDLSWLTLNAESCVASGGDAAAGDWSGSRADTGTQTDVSVPAISPATTVYTLTCIGIHSGNPISASIELNEDSGHVFSVVKPIYKEQ